MTPSERRAVKALHADIDRERARANCPCVRTLLIILSKGLANIAEAGEQGRRAA